MNEEYVHKFTEAIAPFLDLWVSVRITCFAVRIRERWVNLGTRVSLRELPPAKPIKISPIENFSAFVVDLPITEVRSVLDTIVSKGVVPLATVPAFENRRPDVYLTRAHAGLLEGTEPRVSWFDTHRCERPYARREYGVDRTCISLTAWCERIFDIAGRDLLDEASSKLRLREPPYDGLDALVSELLPGILLQHQVQAAIQIVAPLPFDLGCSQKRALIVRVPRSAFGGNAELRLFFGPKQHSLRVPVDIARTVDTEETGVVRWECPIDWPAGSEWVKAYFYYREEEIDTIEVNRWPSAGNLRVAVDAHFDPGHKHLRSFVLGKENKRAQNFEMGVVRMLNLLGIPLVWYGKGATSGRADVAACLLEVGGQKLVVVGECTRERPEEKFSALAERARQLREHLADEVQILPVVFTPSQATEPQISQAAAHRIYLVGRSELEVLFQALETHPTPDEVIKYLQSLWPSSIGIRRLIAPWQSPWQSPWE